MVFSCLVLEVEEDGGDDGAVERLWQWPSLPCKKERYPIKKHGLFLLLLWEIIEKDEWQVIIVSSALQEFILMLFINLLNRYKWIQEHKTN